MFFSNLFSGVTWWDIVKVIFQLPRCYKEYLPWGPIFTTYLLLTTLSMQCKAQTSPFKYQFLNVVNTNKLTIVGNPMSPGISGNDFNTLCRYSCKKCNWIFCLATLYFLLTSLSRSSSLISCFFLFLSNSSTSLYSSFGQTQS